MPVTRRDFLTLTGAGLLGCTAPRNASGPEENGAVSRRPNVVLILSDDLGYADLGIHGCPDIPTPHIDSLAKDGMRFTNGYVSAPVCSPTRAGLMTGRYQQRFGWEVNPSWPVKTPAMCLNEVTMAETRPANGRNGEAAARWRQNSAGTWARTPAG